MSDETTYDLPSEEDVYQESDPSGIIVPVEVRNIVRTDELPTRTFYRNIVLGSGAPAQKVLNGDPHRKRVVLWAQALDVGCEGVCISGRQGDADQFAGAILYPGTGPLRYEFTDRGEIWAKGLVINVTTGTWEGYGPSTDDAVLSIAVEQWAG